MVDLDHLHPTFRDRVLATGVGLNSGARSHARQQELWDDYQAGRGNPANRPGTSWHEYDESVAWPPADGVSSALDGGPWAMAVDFAEPYPYGAEGLCWPIPGEPWHAQPIEIAERQRTGGAWRRLPLPSQEQPAPPADPFQIGDRHVLVLDNALQKVVIVTFADKAIDIPGGAVGDGVAVQQWKRNGSPAQDWYVDPCGTPDHPDEIRLIAGCSGRVLDVAGGGPAGTRLIQWPWNGSDNQRWRIVPTADGTVTVLASRRDLAVDVAFFSIDDGVPIVAWHPTGATNQALRLVATA